MKLDGPKGPKVKMMYGRRTIRPVVTGVFPPELAPRYRDAANALARQMEPKLDEIYERVNAATMKRILYGAAEMGLTDVLATALTDLRQPPVDG